MEAPCQAEVLERAGLGNGVEERIEEQGNVGFQEEGAGLRV